MNSNNTLIQKKSPNPFFCHFGYFWLFLAPIPSYVSEKTNEPIPRIETGQVEEWTQIARHGQGSKKTESFKM